MQKNILVISTGGTIGAAAKHGVIGISSHGSSHLVDLYRSQGYSMANVEFITKKAMNILSENSRPQHWSDIVEIILDSGVSGLDGVIVTHGTDTLPFAASALGFCLFGISIPVVLVSSNR